MRNRVATFYVNLDRPQVSRRVWKKRRIGQLYFTHTRNFTKSRGGTRLMAFLQCKSRPVPFGRGLRVWISERNSRENVWRDEERRLPSSFCTFYPPPRVRVVVRRCIPLAYQNAMGHPGWRSKEDKETDQHGSKSWAREDGKLSSRADLRRKWSD